MTTAQPITIGTPGIPWGPTERAAWLATQKKRRSYADEVLAPIEALRERLDVRTYGRLDYGGESYPLMALRSRAWREGLPVALVTGGVHGYETSGVHGALRFAALDLLRYDGRCNVLIAPCISPWAYERIHRWNPDAVDPNRSFRENSPAQEAAALQALVAPLRASVRLHIDLHETTDSDETEFRPALAARDGRPSEPGIIPDGFYLVGDSERPRLAFQEAIIAAVAAITHIAPADERGEIIGTPIVAPGIIEYPVRRLGLCTSVSDAVFTTTTEVYPDSPRATADQCNAAQATAVVAALEYLLAHGE